MTRNVKPTNTENNTCQEWLTTQMSTALPESHAISCITAKTKHGVSYGSWDNYTSFRTCYSRLPPKFRVSCLNLNMLAMFMIFSIKPWDIDGQPIGHLIGGVETLHLTTMGHTKLNQMSPGASPISPPKKMHCIPDECSGKNGLDTIIYRCFIERIPIKRPSSGQTQMFSWHDTSLNSDNLSFLNCQG